MECLAQLFEEEGALDKLEAFSSLNGPGFYRLPLNEDTITLEKRSPDYIPAEVPVAGSDIGVQVFTPPQKLEWRLS